MQGIKALVKVAEPCVVLLKNDAKWIVLAWTPDTAPVNSRMVGLFVEFSMFLFTETRHLRFYGNRLSITFRYMHRREPD
jgi:hypothetical protein